MNRTTSATTPPPRRDDAGVVIRHSRYTRLLEEVIKEGAKTKVLMLSATPVNTSLLDLRNQIYLMTEKREDVFQDSLGISNIRTLLGQAQKAFKAWEESLDESSDKDKSELLEILGSDFFQLLGGVSIARSRRQIEQFYAEEISRIGEFPKQLKPINCHPLTDLKGALSYKALSEQIEAIRPVHLHAIQLHYRPEGKATVGTRETKTAIQSGRPRAVPDWDDTHELPEAFGEFSALPHRNTQTHGQQN